MRALSQFMKIRRFKFVMPSHWQLLPPLASLCKRTMFWPRQLPRCLGSSNGTVQMRDVISPVSISKPLQGPSSRSHQLRSLLMTPASSRVLMRLFASGTSSLSFQSASPSDSHLNLSHRLPSLPMSLASFQAPIRENFVCSVGRCGARCGAVSVSGLDTNPGQMKKKKTMQSVGPHW